MDFISYIFGENGEGNNCKALKKSAMEQFSHKTVEAFLSGLVHKKLLELSASKMGLHQA